jgi:hypothetical protein
VKLRFETTPPPALASALWIRAASFGLIGLAGFPPAVGLVFLVFILFSGYKCQWRHGEILPKRQEEGTTARRKIFSLFLRPKSIAAAPPHLTKKIQQFFALQISIASSLYFRI